MSNDTKPASSPIPPVGTRVAWITDTVDPQYPDDHADVMLTDCGVITAIDGDMVTIEWEGRNCGSCAVHDWSDHRWVIGDGATKIGDVLRRIDLTNGDVNHFLRHLATSLAL